MKHLDAEYRRRFQEYHLNDGTKFDSREINWRDVKWEKVKKIVTNINKQIHVMETNDPNFKCFMCFRWAGREAIYDDDKNFLHHKPINIWTTGYTDGKTCFLTDIDFFTGNKLKEYTTPFKELKAHIHPRITPEMLKKTEVI